MRVIAAANGGPVSRLGVAAPRMSNAVNRNRARRRLREAARPLLAAHPGHDFIVSAGPPSLEMPFLELVAAVNEAGGQAVTRLLRRQGAAPRAQNVAHAPTAPAVPGREPTL